MANLPTGGIRIRYDGRLQTSNHPDVDAGVTVIQDLLRDLKIWDDGVRIEPEEDTPIVKGYPKMLIMTRITDLRTFTVDRLVEVYDAATQVNWPFKVFNYPGFIRVMSPRENDLVPVGIPNSTLPDGQGGGQRTWLQMHHLSRRNGGQLFVACSGPNRDGKGPDEYWRGDHQVLLNTLPGLKLFAENELPDADEVTP